MKKKTVYICSPVWLSSMDIVLNWSLLTFFSKCTLVCFAREVCISDRIKNGEGQKVKHTGNENLMLAFLHIWCSLSTTYGPFILLRQVYEESIMWPVLLWAFIIVRRCVYIALQLHSEGGNPRKAILSFGLRRVYGVACAGVPLLFWAFILVLRFIWSSKSLWRSLWIRIHYRPRCRVCSHA